MTYRHYNWTQCGNAWRLTLIAPTLIFGEPKNMARVWFCRKKIHGIKILRDLKIELSPEDQLLSANY